MSIIAAIIIFNLLIFVHELGHFFACNMCKVKVEEFSLGMGPKLIGKDIKGTFYSIRTIPIGGFVRMNEDDYGKTSWWKQIIIISAGVVFNLIFAIIGSWLYIALSPIIQVNILIGFLLGFTLVFNMVMEILAAVYNIFVTVDTSSFAGPVGVVDTINTYVQSGFLNAIEIFVVLNLNLLVMNLLPIPVLDGGHVVLILIKKIFKKDNMPKFETVWNIVGLIFLALLLFFAFKNDFVNFF